MNVLSYPFRIPQIFASHIIWLELSLAMQLPVQVDSFNSQKNWITCNPRPVCQVLKQSHNDSVPCFELVGLATCLSWGMMVALRKSKGRMTPTDICFMLLEKKQNRDKSFHFILLHLIQYKLKWIFTILICTLWP